MKLREVGQIKLAEVGQFCLALMTKYIERLPVIRELFRECRGNIVRVREELESRYGIAIPYQTLTWIIRNHGGWLEANWWENKWFQSLGLMFPWI